jgi:hypothetical protein
MGRDEIVKRLVAHGMKAELCEGLSDLALAEMLRVLEAKDPAQKDPEAVKEAAQVAKHFEKFSENFPRGSTKQGLVSGFLANRRHDRTLTAAKFLGR